MDAVNTLRGRGAGSASSSTAKTPETRLCGYCKGKFGVDPKFPHKKFCSDTHRKLAHRYGALSIGKIAERTMRDARKMLEAELMPLRDQLQKISDRLDALEAWVDLSARIGEPHDSFPIRYVPESQRTA